MKSFSSKCLVALAVFACVMLALRADAQNEGKKAKKGPDPTAQMSKKLESAELTADPKAKYEAVAKEHGPKLKAAMAKVNSLLTPEQMKAKNEASKAAKAAGKKGKEAADAVSEALKLSDEQKQKMADAEKELRAAQASFNAAVADILTPEQKEKTKIGVGKKKNK
jgi:Spy/CpxP family protein refolding chaperone